MWTGENKTEGEGRALLPPPKAVWGSPGSGKSLNRKMLASS